MKSRVMVIRQTWMHRLHLGSKLTFFRLLIMILIFAIGITKGVLTSKGQTATPTTLDWVGGALLVSVWVNFPFSPGSQRHSLRPRRC